MVYVGVDIGKTRHALAAVDNAGSVVAPPRFIRQDAEGFATLLDLLQSWGGPATVVVALEATGPYWKALRQFLEQQGYRADVINPLLTAHEAAADVRGRKTDKLDACAIAQVARRGGYSPAPSTHPAFDALKSLSRQRRHLVGRRTEAKMRYSSSLDELFPEARRVFGDLYSATALAVLERFPSARQLAQAHIRTLATLVAQASGGHYDRAFAESLRTAARQSVSHTLVNEGEEFVLTQLIAEIRALAHLIE
ncbi:MAG TPA: IS110 family transposase [Candidatus Brocadiia bacterium]|nr:IS110 family transposase [Candidatus Brocadiia bacterium]